MVSMGLKQSEPQVEVKAMTRRPAHSERRISQIAQAYRNAHEIVSACLGLAMLTGAGFWLDKHLGWSPVLTICGALVGSLTAAASLRRLLQRLDRESRQQRMASAQRSQPSKKEGETP
jgi:F0F1-type ATP synthase assembly protein I